MTTLAVVIVALVVVGLVPAVWWAVPSVMHSLERIATALEELVNLKKRGR